MISLSPLWLRRERKSRVSHLLTSVIRLVEHEALTTAPHSAIAGE
jgi:hypothetical protein